MKILLINSGSSSIKYQLIEMPERTSLSKGIIERIGIEGGSIHHQYIQDRRWKEFNISFEVSDHRIGLNKIHALLTDHLTGVIQSPNEITAIGHRVVHGGSVFSTTVEITSEVQDEIRKVFSLAPLHNPANMMGIEVAQEVFPNAREFAIFDTAFHQTIPEKAYRYALPDFLYTKEHVRVYGFHGMSHQYVSRKTLDYLENPEAKIITLHLGNGASIAAIQGGISMDTSMGFGPNSGLIMGTRSGDIDTTILFHLLGKGYTYDDLSKMLNHHSGMLAISGKSDMRDIGEAYKKKDIKADLAYEMYVYRIKKYIGAYSAIMNGLDAIVFTGGIGENDILARDMICAHMDFLGLILDKEKNTMKDSNILELQSPESRVKILVLPTNEEMEMAREVFTFF